MTDDIWLDRPSEKDDFVQLIRTKRMYTVLRILPDGKVRIWARNWPVLNVWPERLRVYNRDRTIRQALKARERGMEE